MKKIKSKHFFWNKSFFSRKVFYSIFIIPFFFLSSCSKESKQSFGESISIVDSFIHSGQKKDAVEKLKQCSKNALSASDRLEIYKRYDLLGEKILAEKTLKNAYKNLSENKEICAVYGHFLLKQNRIEDSLKILKNLKDTKYSSIYSLAILKSINTDSIYSKEYTEILIDAYNSTNDEMWLLRAAVPYLREGDYAKVSAMQKNITAQFPLFWAKVHFDAGFYDLCLENLENDIDESYLNQKTLLQSDALYLLNDFDESEKKREELIALSSLENGFEADSNLFVNSAIYLFNSGNFSESYDLLTKVIFKNQVNIPALVTYAKFALLDSKKEEIDFLESELRKTNLKTLEMQEYDLRAKFLIKDAQYRIQNAIKFQKAEGKNASPELLIESLKLKFAENQNLIPSQKIGEIWKVLEENEIAENFYPPLLVNYAVSEFIKMDKIQDARNLFNQFVEKKYKTNVTSTSNEEKKEEFDVFGGIKNTKKSEIEEKSFSFLNEDFSFMPKADIWELEMAAYFEILDGNINNAKKLYEYVVFGSENIKPDSNKDYISRISRFAGISSCANLAEIYVSEGEYNKALSLYAISSGKTKNKLLKSKILYRMAVVQEYLGNKKGAILSLDYAISINPQNANARLLRNKIKGE